MRVDASVRGVDRRRGVGWYPLDRRETLLGVDTELVEAARAGDQEAVAAIVDDFMPTVLGAAYGLCGDWDAAGDVAQETFATMVVRLGDLREAAALPGWLMAIVRSCARRQRSRRAPVLRSIDDPAGPEEIVLARDDARRLRLAVEALTPELRLPMVLHYFAGHPLAQVAELCDVPLSTVKQRMRVARTRLREGMDTMADEMAARLRPEPQTDPSDAVRLYTAMRSGDVARVAAILDARPDLVDVREDWTRADSFAHRLPWTNGGTPLLRAVERGDAGMVALLLGRGADPDGPCACAGGESPLWVAVAQREADIVELLLRHGADPNATAFAGASALDVARRRGYDDIAARLLDTGATPSAMCRESVTDVPAQTTGIKTIDLWCPLPERGLVHLTPGYGLGAIVLIAELSYRAATRGRLVVWTGFAPAPTDLGDIHHALAESDLVDRVTVSIAAPTAPPRDQLAALDRGISRAGDGALLVVFGETGRLHTIEERLAALAARNGVTLIVGPLDGSVGPPRRHGSPYLASIEFDAERARRGRWPAVGSSSWSRSSDVATAALAERARAGMTDALDDYLAQPFFVAEHVTGRPGELVTGDELHDRVSELATTTPSCRVGDPLIDVVPGRGNGTG